MKQTENNWNESLKSKLPKIAVLLSSHQIVLDEEQPHTGGERFLMQALTTIGGQKFILLGKHTHSGKRVVIKASDSVAGKQELKHERLCRTLLHQVNFSYESFHSPTEVLFIEKSGYVLYVTEFIEQSSSFLERPLSSQFSFALRALKAQEQTRATTAKHVAQISKVFGNRSSDDYLRMFNAFTIAYQIKSNELWISDVLSQAYDMLSTGVERIEQYGSFLTHTDFVPHNFRISGDTLYLLDFSSLCFGNKHESWARFLNFMTLYNPELETLLIDYMEKNRSEEERESLQLMRIFRLGEIITYYVNTVDKSSGNLLALNQIRIRFWGQVLEAELKNRRVSSEIVLDYKKTRDGLRSEEEKRRQIGLH